MRPVGHHRSIHCLTPPLLLWKQRWLWRCNTRCTGMAACAWTGKLMPAAHCPTSLHHPSSRAHHITLSEAAVCGSGTKRPAVPPYLSWPSDFSSGLHLGNKKSMPEQLLLQVTAPDWNASGRPFALQQGALVRTGPPRKLSGPQVWSLSASVQPGPRTGDACALHLPKCAQAIL